MTETRFTEYVKEMVRWYLQKRPVMGTFMGVHTEDHRLADLSAAGLESFYGELKRYLAVLEEMDPAGWTKEGQIDLEMVTRLLQGEICSFEQVAAHRRNPGFYLDEIMEGIFVLVIKDFAPLEERLENVLGRVGEVGRVVKEARENLEPALIPPVWVEVALQQLRAAPALFESLLPSIAAPYPSLQKELAAAGREAALALRKFAVSLEKEILPVAAGDFAVGEAYFNFLLKEQHLVDYDAGELLETGRRLFDETRAELEALAGRINPHKTLETILDEDKENHPAAGRLLDEYRRAMEESRRYVVEHNIATIPPGEALRVIETPAYLRPLVPYAAYLPPGIFEEKLEGLFLVTPPEERSSAEEQKEKLKGHPYSKLPVTALHEGYPGHHLQLVWSGLHGSTARKFSGLMLSTLFIEGWAFYCEELMEQLGYIDSPAQKLGRLADQLWRAARIILDVSLHCRGMTVEEAVHFLVEKCRLQRGDALAEVRRYTMMPTQPQSYLMGKLEILKIIREYRHRHPEASLREMHDAILGCGSLPPRLMRKQLFD